MPATMAQARDAILAQVKATTDTIVALAPNVIFDDTSKKVPDGQNPVPTWARVTIRHQTGAQSSLSGGLGQRLFTRRGVVTIQLFTPAGKGLVEHDSIVEQLLNIFQGGTAGTGGVVWFRNPRDLEAGQDGPWHQSNVLADFEYDFVG